MIVNDSSAREPLIQKGISIGQLCSCVEQEVFSMLTLDLTENILVAINQNAGDVQKFSNSPIGKEYGNRFVSALSVCVQQMKRGK